MLSGWLSRDGMLWDAIRAVEHRGGSSQSCQAGWEWRVVMSRGDAIREDDVGKQGMVASCRVGVLASSQLVGWGAVRVIEQGGPVVEQRVARCQAWRGFSQRCRV